jgi:hypothetical protein
VTENIRLEKLKSTQCDLLVKYFTVRELEALQHFYETPEGVAVQEKLAKLNDEFKLQIMTEALRAFQETLRELKEPPGKAPSPNRDFSS